MINRPTYTYLFLAISLIFLYGCPSNSNEGSTESKRAGINEVIVHELSDPDKLNPITSTGAGATYIKYNIFMYLLDVNKETLEMNPSLAKSRPAIKVLTEGEYKGGISIEYEIRPEAVWDNGDPVTGYDVDFTLKTTKNPLVDAEHLRPYLDFIDHIVIDPGNPKKFTLYSKQPFFAAESSSGFQAFIAPEYIYDPDGVMRNFTLNELNNPKNRESLRSDPGIIKFAEEFNSETYQREKGFVVGCGPYEFVSWTTGQRIILKKKQNWWGDQLAGSEINFGAYPDKIIYEIVNDRTTALTAIKDEQMDISRSSREKDYYDLQSHERFKQKFHLFNPTSLSYTYIGMNMKNPVLSDVLVRKALAHVVDRDQIIKVLMYGLAEPINGPFHPTKDYYNSDIKGYDFDLEIAGNLLDEAEWKDTDGNGIRDKVIDGSKSELKFTYKYNSGNDTREKIGLFFKKSAEKVGIKIEIIAKEWTIFLDETKNHQFDLYCLGWVQDPTKDDPKQIWHTDSYNRGSNNVGFGNEKTDELIESIRREMDDDARSVLYKEFQQIVNEEVPYIFLYTPYSRIIMNKRFENSRAYIARPGYTERELMSGSGTLASEN